MLSVCIAVMAILLVFAPLSVFGATATASLTGPGTVRAGDLITLTFSLGGTNIEAVSGTLQYNGTQLEKTGEQQIIPSPWMVEYNGLNMLAYDNDLSSPVNAARGLFTVSFRVKNITPGTLITVSYVNVIASDGNEDVNIGTVSYQIRVAEPLSANNALSSLTVGNAVLTPAFSAGNTSYTAEVPFDVSVLNVTATAADGRSNVNVNSPTLMADGYTDVTVTVTAENGAVRIYTIRVHRAKDPNYVPSGDNTLSGITVEGFLLSPAFDSERTEYVVWLPYETDSINVSAAASDGKAEVSVSGGEGLKAGSDNRITVTCKAENGDEKVYTVIAKRAAPFGEDTAETEPNDTDGTDTDNAETVDTDDITTDESPGDSTEEPPRTETADRTPWDGKDNGKKGNSDIWWQILIVALLGIIVGFLCGYCLKRRGGGPAFFPGDDGDDEDDENDENDKNDENGNDGNDGSGTGGGNDGNSGNGNGGDGSVGGGVKSGEPENAEEAIKRLFNMDRE